MMRRFATLIRIFVVTLAIGAAAFVVQAAILLWSDEPQSTLVLFVPHATTASLPSGVSILDWSGMVARLDGVDATAARSLYGTGAILVLPMRSSGCLALR